MDKKDKNEKKSKLHFNVDPPNDKINTDVETVPKPIKTVTTDPLPEKTGFLLKPFSKTPIKNDVQFFSEEDKVKYLDKSGSYSGVKSSKSRTQIRFSFSSDMTIVSLNSELMQDSTPHDGDHHDPTTESTSCGCVKSNETLKDGESRTDCECVASLHTIICKKSSKSTLKMHTPPMTKPIFIINCIQTFLKYPEIFFEKPKDIDDKITTPFKLICHKYSNNNIEMRLENEEHRKTFINTNQNEICSTFIINGLREECEEKTTVKINRIREIISTELVNRNNLDLWWTNKRITSLLNINLITPNEDDSDESIPTSEKTIEHHFQDEEKQMSVIIDIQNEADLKTIDHCECCKENQELMNSSRIESDFNFEDMMWNSSSTLLNCHFYDSDSEISFPEPSKHIIGGICTINDATVFIINGVKPVTTYYTRKHEKHKVKVSRISVNNVWDSFCTFLIKSKLWLTKCVSRSRSNTSLETVSENVIKIQSLQCVTK